MALQQPRGSEKGRKSLVLFVFVGVRIWFSNGDACYVEAEVWFHEPGTMLKGKTVQEEEQKDYGAGKERSGGRGK